MPKHNQPNLSAVSTGVVIIHAPCDATVPFSDSVLLQSTSELNDGISKSKCKLITETDPSGHRLDSCTVENIQLWLQEAQSLHANSYNLKHCEPYR